MRTERLHSHKNNARCGRTDETMKLFIDAVWESLYHYGEELCGDKVEIVRNDGFFLMVLADGLGSGVKANILSTLTSKIIATMMAQGASLEEAVETIASTLPVCQDRGIAYSILPSSRWSVPAAYISLNLTTRSPYGCMTV